jgi:hypothetical protein
MNKPHICISDLPAKAIIPYPINKLLIFRGVLGVIIIQIKPLLNNN